MYQIYCDNVLIGDSRIEELCVINPIAELEVNASGWFTFTFPATHPHINTITPLTSVIKVLRDNKLIFQGFCSNPSEDIFGNKTITCEGELSYFNDSILRQAKYTGINARTLLETYINLHNAQVEPRKQFTLGRVNTDFVAQNVYCFTNMQSTLQEIKEDLVDDFGGYISVRYENGVKYIDYLSDSDSLNSQQTIELGKNLITYNSNIDNTVIATRVIPLGAQLETEVVEGLPARLDIKSVNDNKDYLDNLTAISNFGTITRVVTWDDVTIASNLKAKGEQWLLDNQFENVTIDVTAIDLSIIDSNFQPFQLFDKVRVISRYHGMDRWFMISKVKYDLANPERDTYTLGKTYRESLTVKANKTVSNVEKVREETSGMETSWLKKAKQQATDLISGVDGGYVVLNVDNQGRPFELLVMDAPTKETARKVWRWNQNGFGYSSTGYDGTYGTAITMNGEIVANFITTGTLTANLIKAGILSDGNGKFSLNMQTGELTMNDGTFTGQIKAGSTISCGKYEEGEYEARFTVDHDGNMWGWNIHADDGITLKNKRFSTPYVDFMKNTSDPDVIDFDARITMERRDEIYFYAHKNMGTQIPSGRATTYAGTAHASNWVTDSSKKIKTNIKDLSENITQNLLNLRPVEYDLRTTGKHNMGLIAEEAEEYMPIIVDIPEGYDPDKEWEILDNVPSIEYSQLIAPIIKLLQEHEERIRQLEEEIKTLKEGE